VQLRREIIDELEGVRLRSIGLLLDLWRMGEFVLDKQHTKIRSCRGTARRAPTAHPRIIKENYSGSFAKFLHLENSLAGGVYYVTDRVIGEKWESNQAARAAKVETTTAS